MENEKEMTVGELIHTERFQKELEKSIKKAFGDYDNAVKKVVKKGREIKRNPMMRLREMGAEDPSKMTELYIGVIDENSELPSTLRHWVNAICEPVLNKFLIEHMVKLKEKEAENGEAGQS